MQSTQREPNRSRWNIGRVGSSRVGARISHVHFMLFVSISFELATQPDTNSGGIWAAFLGICKAYVESSYTGAANLYSKSYMKQPAVLKSDISPKRAQ